MVMEQLALPSREVSAHDLVTLAITIDVEAEHRKALLRELILRLPKLPLEALSQNWSTCAPD